MAEVLKNSKGSTSTKSFGVSKRESHNSDGFYERFTPPVISTDHNIVRPQSFIDLIGNGKCLLGDSSKMDAVPDNSVGLVVTSPPYFVGKDYEIEIENSPDSSIPKTYIEFLQMLRKVFKECLRVLEPGGRIAVNVANLGRKPYRSLSADVIGILQDDLGMLLRGEVIWEKSKTSSGSCAWGSFAKASNPVIRDMTERVIIASKGRFDRAIDSKKRSKSGLPNQSTLTNDEFMQATTDVWQIDAESAKRIGHPAPFPVELPQRIINMFTYVGDVVLDPFCGSGSTLVAASKTDRLGLGFDTDSNYVDLANSRLSDLSEGFDGQSTYEVGLVAGKKVKDIAAEYLIGIGYSLDETKKAIKTSNGVEYDFLATDNDGKRYWVEVAGSYSCVKPGLKATDDVLKILGRASLAKLSKDPLPVLVATPELPKPASLADKYLINAVEQGLLVVKQILI